jgi:hypothetical protein
MSKPDLAFLTLPAGQWLNAKMATEWKVNSVALGIEQNSLLTEPRLAYAIQKAGWPLAGCWLR